MWFFQFPGEDLEPERLHASMCSLHAMTQCGESPRFLFAFGRDAADELAVASFL